MTYRNYVVATSIVILGLIAISAYLYVDRATLASNWWSVAIQHREGNLRQVAELESMLERGEFSDLSIELQRYRQSSLNGLVIMMTQQFAPGSPNLAYALRVFCSEVPVDLPAPKNGSDEISIRIIKGTETECERSFGNSS